MATMGLLITIAVVVSTTVAAGSPSRIAKSCIVTSSVLVLFGAWLFLWRMYFYSRIVNEMLPKWYTQRLPSVSLSGAILVIAAATSTMLAALSIVVALRPARPTQP